MEDWNLGDHLKFHQLEESEYLKKVYYGDSNVTWLKPMKCGVRVEWVSLLNMLWVWHFSSNTIKMVFVHQLLTMVHDGCIWLGGPITHMLIHCMTLLSYQGVDPLDAFVGKS